MRTGTKRAAALAIAILTASIVTPVKARDGVTWMRTHVQEQQMARIQRHLKPGSISDVAPSIVGGKVAAPGRWPFQAGILDASVASNANAQFCGGSLIGPRHVLTAAHCVDFLTSPNQIQVLLETQSLAHGGTRQRVASFVYHPKWNPITADFDIAVITLRDGLNDALPVRMLTRRQEAALAGDGTRATVIGWGDTLGSGAGRFPTELNQVRVPIVPRSICNSPQSYDGDITRRMICAGYRAGGKDSCQGDSGGPLLVRGGSGRWRIQAGIVSWGIGCALPDLYGVYTRLAVLSGWVKAVVNSASPVSGAMRCDERHGPAQVACLDRAIASVAAETKAYLDQIRRDGSPRQRAGVEAEQRAWSLSLATRCAFDATARGELGRKECLLRESRSRAGTLAAFLSDIDG